VGLCLNEVSCVNFGRAPCGQDVQEYTFPVDWEAFARTPLPRPPDCDHEVFVE
jgi:hypothetical protein